jgi:hypothetical protein
VPSVENAKTDTFTYTFSQLALDKLFIIMAELAYAGDTESLSLTPDMPL